MGRITTNIGLITGVPITDTVDQLIAIEARPRDLLVSRNQTLSTQQAAVTDLTARLLTLQFQTRQILQPSLFSEVSVSSSDSSVLAATVTGTPSVGSYQFTPVRQATSQQLLSSTFSDDVNPIGAGTLELRHGGLINEGLNLNLLNGGSGFERGKIRVTDRSGASADIDLRYARTVDDVLQAVNENSSVNVTLSVSGDKFVLTDETGQTTSNLKVQEVGATTTAASLGLAGVDVAAEVAEGSDVLSLFGNLTLDLLNDGSGVRFESALPELEFTLRDGSKVNVDFDRLPSSEDQAVGTTSAANGATANLTFTATSAGADFDGYQITFVDDAGVTQGSEVVEYDTQAKTLSFRIDEGNTTADDIIAALAAHGTASLDFTATKSNGLLFASATTTTANGSQAEVRFTARSGGPAFDDFDVTFVDDAGVTQGNEFAIYDDVAGTIEFHIDLGSTTAEDIVAAAANNSALSGDFDVDTPDHFAEATTTAANGANAQVSFTAQVAGASLDDVEIVFQDNASVTKGNETVVFDDTPGAKQLVFQIDAGNTTAEDIAAALAADATASTSFTATAGGDGQGLIDVSDTATTAGGAPTGLIDTADTATTSGGLSGLVSSTDSATTYGGAATEAFTELTLSDVIATINAAAPGRLTAQIASGGDRLEIIDGSTDQGETFSVTSTFSPETLADLGLNVTAVGDTLTGSRLLGGLKSTLLSSLNGGQGLGTLGTLDLIDRDGTSFSADLSSAETLDDVASLIESAAGFAGALIEVSYNDARSGIVIRDNSGGTGNLQVSSTDETATLLGVTIDDSVDQIDSGNLNLQFVSLNTRLDDLNGGRGVAAGSFQIVDSAGLVNTISIDPASSTQTIGDVVDLINSKAISVEARINDTGDGILLVDKASGSGTLTVSAIAGSSAAADLGLLAEVVELEIEGQTRQVVDGRKTYRVEITDTDTLDDLVEKLNGAGAGVSVGKLGDGSLNNPFRLSILGSETGDRANLTFDTSGVAFTFTETVRAQDALLQFGGDNTGLLVSSGDNQFEEILPGVRLTVTGESDGPVTVSVNEANTKLVSSIEALVGSFNALRDKLDELTFFDESSGQSGPLFGSNEALRIDTELSSILSGGFAGLGQYQALESIGIGLTDDGHLVLDTEKLLAAIENDSESVEKLISDEDRGFATRFDQLIETLAGQDTSLLVNRAAALASKVEINNERIEFYNLRLDRRRELLLEQFVRMEEVIGRMQSDLAALDSIQSLAPLSVDLSSG